MTGGSQLLHSSCTDNTHGGCQDIAPSTLQSHIHTNSTVHWEALRVCALPSDAMGDVMQLQSWHLFLGQQQGACHCTSHNVQREGDVSLVWIDIYTKTEYSFPDTQADKLLLHTPLSKPCQYSWSHVPTLTALLSVCVRAPFCLLCPLACTAKPTHTGKRESHPYDTLNKAHHDLCTLQGCRKTRATHLLVLYHARVRPDSRLLSQLAPSLSK